MPIKVRIPTPLQTLTQGEQKVAAAGRTVRDLLADLESRYPGFKQRLYDDSGSLRRFVNGYVNDEDIRFLDGEDTALKEEDELSIIPAVAGGGSLRWQDAR
jgi:molybdopterin synthase sulfur carrier subunit